MGATTGAAAEFFLILGGGAKNGEAFCTGGLDGGSCRTGLRGGEFLGAAGRADTSRGGEGGSFGKIECEDGGDSGIPLGAGTFDTGAIADIGALLIGAIDL